MDRVFDFSAIVRTALLVAFTLAVAALGAIASPAGATPATQLGTSAIAGQTAVDGGVMYATNGRVVSRINIADGTSRTILVASRGFSVDYILAGGGVAAIQMSKNVKKRPAKTRAVAYTDATGSTRVLATGALSVKRKFLCGTEVAVTDVTEAGEAITVRGSIALSRKRCRKPVSSSAIVRGHSAAGVRVLYTGRSSNSRSFASLGGFIFGAELSGSKLTLTGAGVGVFDLTSQQFVLVRAAGRRTIFIGTADKNANTLIVGVPLRGKKVKYEIVDAASGYTVATPIETTSQAVVFESCGDYLLRSQFAQKRGSANTVTVVPNPLIPAAAPNPDQLVPAGEYLLDASCDASSVVFTTLGASVRAANMWRAPLAG